MKSCTHLLTRLFLALAMIALLFGGAVQAQTKPKQKPAKRQTDQEEAKKKKAKAKKAKQKKESKPSDYEPKQKTKKKKPTSTAAEKAESNNGVDNAIFSPLKLRSIGPAFMSGRIGDLAVDQKNPNTWYVAVASGGVFKTVNAGTTFDPIFDNYSSYSIGCVTVDPNNSNIVWVGTGENNGGRHIGFGDGIYVSHNAGKTFENVGLKKSEHLSKILVDPRDSNVVFAASQGPLWSPGGERGLYKTTDGGETWKNVLSKGPYTGVTDVVMDPANPDVLYAATHQRHRNIWAIVNAGPETGIYKSVDGGENWRQLKNGLPGADKGKISLGVSPQKPNVVYATIELAGRKGGFWRSEDHGESWTKTSDFVSGGTGPHYYQELWVDPHRYGVLYQANNSFVRSVDDGATWDVIEGRKKHVDNHAVAFHPSDPDFLLVGCDGGVYRSFDFCKTYEFFGNLPISQYYKVDVDYDFPFYHVAGGTQDNYSHYGPTRTNRVQGIVNADWVKTIGGDGHDGAIDYEDPNTIYAESQQGFIRRYDRRTGEAVDIRPRPEDGQDDFRFNWDAPILISPHSHKRIYFGSNFLHRSDDRGDSWTTISPDLSKNQNRFELPTMGRVPSIDAAYDLYAMSQFGNITSISESPVVEGLLYVGTDDGLIQVSEDGGKNWRKVEQIYGIPEGSFINDVKADLHDADTVYACLDNHKQGDYQPLLVRSTDRGRTWKSMIGDLPDRHLVWRIVQDHEMSDLFFLATEYGIFFSRNAGENWSKLKGSPTISFRDLAIQKRENDLVGASFGRSFYVLDDYSPLRHADAENTKDDSFHVFPIRDALWYPQADSLGGRYGFQGDRFYSADNPPYGVTFTYYNGKSYKTKKQKRQEAEAKQKDGDIKTPSWDELAAEQEESPASVVFEVRSKAGDLISRFNGSTGKGMHRATWSMRYTALSGGFGPLTSPGVYYLEPFELVDGKMTSLAEPTEFAIKMAISADMPLADKKKFEKFHQRVVKLMNSANALSGTFEQRKSDLSSVKSNLTRLTAGTPELINELTEIEKSLAKFEKPINGDEIRDDRYVPVEPTISGRLRNAMFGGFSTQGPTQTHLKQVDIAASQLTKATKEFRQFESKTIEPFLKKLNKAGVPWTQGRAIPDPAK
ncbi:MAG: glycosyl hydrolase [Planctomycetota bacterium]